MHIKYKRMVKGMQKTAGEKKADPDESWHVYILRCRDGSLYTGITKDLQNRFNMHNKGKASKYTRTRLPVKCVYTETCPDRAKALLRECELKAYSKKRKEELVRETEINSKD